MKRTDDSINAELKHLRLRIKKLEALVLRDKSDMGNVSDKINNEKKG